MAPGSACDVRCAVMSYIEKVNIQMQGVYFYEG